MSEQHHLSVRRSGLYVFIVALALAAPASGQEVRGILAEGLDGLRAPYAMDPGFCGPLYAVPTMMGSHEGPSATRLQITGFPVVPIFATYTGATAQIPDVTQPAVFNFISGNPNALLPDILGATSIPPAVDNSGDGLPGTFTGLAEVPALTQIVAANTPFPGTVVFSQGQAVLVSAAPILFQAQSVGTDPNLFRPEVDGDVQGLSGNAPFNGFELQYQYLFMRDAFTLVLPNPTSTSITGRTKISQNGAVLPRTRAFLDYSILEAEDLAGGFTFHRFTPGLERAFWGGLASIELRMPIAVTADSAVSADAPFAEGHSEYGNASLALKALMVRTPRFGFSGGLQVAFPTASDTTVSLADGTRILEVENEAIHLLPFVGAVYDSQTILFAHMFAQFDIDANGNGVRGNPTLTPGGPLVDAPDLNDADRFYFDIATGLWLYRSPDAPRGPLDLIALAPTLEFHYTQGLGRPDVVQLGSLQVGAPSDAVEKLDVVLGGSAILDGGVVTAGVSVPVTGDKTHDWEFRLLLNRAIR